MKAIHIALLWAASFMVYAVILILMYAFIPQGKLFAFYSDLTGPVSGTEWDNIISNFFILGSAAITFLLVWAAACIALKNRNE